MSPQAFKDVLAAAGLRPKWDPVSDGELRRVACDCGPNCNRNGWYRLRKDPVLRGWYGCWRCGEGSTAWSSRDGAPLTPEEREQIRLADLANAKAEKEEQEAIAVNAAAIRASLLPASPDHLYLESKKVRPHGLLEGELNGKWALMVPLEDQDGKTWSCQWILPAREGGGFEKLFEKGGRVRGLFHPIGDWRQAKVLVICEGFATGATIHEATGLPVLCAMSCGNLKAVAEEVRKVSPKVRLVFAADNDSWNRDGSPRKDNPGLEKATKAARAVNGSVVAPGFKDTTSKPTDFNDLSVLEGAEEVKRQIEEAVAAGEEKEPPMHEQKSPGSLPASPSNSPHESNGDGSTGSTAAQVMAKPTDATCTAELRRLAALTPMAYELERIEAAKRLGIKRVTVLDAEVSKLRAGPAVTAGQGRAVSYDDPATWSEPVDGADLLDELSAVYSRHVILPPGAAYALALWAVSTYAGECFSYAPIIHIAAPERQCGKSLTRDVSIRLVHRPLSSESATPAFLFRVIERDRPTLFLDEFDNADLEARRELLAILNSGFHTSGSVGRVVGEDHEPRTFSTYCPKMLVSIGNPLPDSTSSRCIRITLRRKLPSESVSRLRGFDGAELRQKCRRWVNDYRDRLTNACSGFPDWMDDRQRDVMEPLLAIADAVGGEWPQRSRDALRLLVGGKVETTAEGTMLLSDLRDIFGDKDRLTTATILESLNRLEERPWPTYNRTGGFNARNLAGMLKIYGVESRSTKMPDGSSPKGFHRDQLEDAFGRYLPSITPSTPALHQISRNPATKAVVIGQNPLWAPATGPLGSGSENPTLPNVYGAGGGVAGEIQEPHPKGVNNGVQAPPHPLDEVDDWESADTPRDTQNDPGK